MSIYGGFETKKQETAYCAYLERMLFLLAKRIAWNIRDNKFDEEKWTNTFRKLYKNLHILDSSKEETPRFSETIKVLAETLQIVPSDDWVLESLSRRSSVSRSRMFRRPSEDGGRKNLSLLNKSREHDPFHHQISPKEQKRRWPILRPAYDNKAGVTLDKILNTSTKASQAYSTKNDDQNFFTGGNPINQTNYYDDSLIENGKVLRTELNLPRGRSKPNKFIDGLLKKRCQTPKMYYRGSFDVNLDPVSKKKHKKANRRISVNPVGLADKVKASLKLQEMNKTANHEETNDYDKEPVLNTTYFHNELETPITIQDGYDLFREKPPRSKLHDRQPSPLKAFTGSFYNGSKALNSRKSSDEMNTQTGPSKYGFDINIAGKIQAVLQSSKANNNAKKFLINTNSENL